MLNLVWFWLTAPSLLLDFLGVLGVPFLAVEGCLLSPILFFPAEGKDSCRWVMLLEEEEVAGVSWELQLSSESRIIASLSGPSESVEAFRWSISKSSDLMRILPSSLLECFQVPVNPKWFHRTPLMLVQSPPHSHVSFCLKVCPPPVLQLLAFVTSTSFG